MARVLVTAGLGNVGREVVRECALHGMTVRVADREMAKAAKRFPQAEAVALDFFDPATWEAALKGCQFVFLLRPPPVGDMRKTLIPFIDLAYSMGVEHLVFLSVAGAEKMNWVPHRKVELHLETTGKKWTVLRPGFFAQNLQDAYRLDITERGRIYVPAAKGKVAFIDVADVGAVAAQVFMDPARFAGQALLLTGPAAVTFDEVAGSLTRVLGKPVRYEAASVFGYAWHLWRTRRLPWMQIMIQTILHVGLRKGDAEQVDPTLERVLARAPHTVDEYVTRAADVWRA